MKMDQISLQAKIIDNITETLKKYKSVIGVVLRGSHVRNENSPFSDIDMIAFFDSDQRLCLKKIYNDISKIKPVLVTLYLIYNNNCLFLYENGVCVDLVVNGPSKLKDWDLTDSKILYDPKGIVNKKIGQPEDNVSKPDKPRWNQNEGVFEDWFFWMFRSAYCCALQANLKPQKQFEKLNQANESINLSRGKLLDTYYYIKGKKDYLNKTNSVLEQKLICTYPSFNVKSMLKAVDALVEIYEIIISEYCIKENIVFPIGKLNIMKKLLGEFRKAR